MAKKRKITAEDLYKIEIMGTSRISPDGKLVVYSSQRVDRKTEKKFSNLFIISVQAGRLKQFTYGNHVDNLAQWSPDGEKLAFLSNRANVEKPSQIYLIPVSGGEACKLTEFTGIIENYSWSPDGKKILFSGVRFDVEMLEREKDEEKKKLGVVARHYDRLFFKLDGFGYLPHERKHIWVVDVASDKTRQVTDHPIFDESDPSWSPDGRLIALISNRSKDPDNDPFQQDLYIMPAKGGEFRKIETPRGSKSQPVFSPDGMWIAYAGAEDEGKMYKNRALWIVPADGSKPPRNLTDQYDEDVGGGVINDLGHGETMPPVWSSDSRWLYFQSGYHGSTLLKRIEIGSEKVETIIDEGGEVGSFSFDADQNNLVYFYGKIDDTGQLFLLNLDTGQSRVLTSHNLALLDQIDLGRVEEVWFKGAAGNDLQGWILTPSDFDPQNQYPSILEIHGGPWAQYGNFIMHEFYYLAANGYVVYFCNPRGGKGYGEQHAAAISGGWGGPDYADLMAWVDFIAQKPYIDNSRMGVTGGSYGGYMTNWIIGHTQRFKAAVTQRSVSNLVSMWGSSDFNYTFQQEFGNKAPFEDISKLWDCSPMKYIGNARTPTLIIHNEMDLRCAIEQGEQVFVALKRLGIDSEMVRFPDEPHGLSRTGRTDRRIARLNHILRWMDKYLK